MITNVIIVFAMALISCKGNQNEDRKVYSVKVPEPVIEVPVSYIMGQFDPTTHKDFTIIPRQYADRDSMYMRKDAFNDFVRMYEVAFKDSINLVIRSAARNFDYQKGIWERKWNGTTILSDGVNAATDIQDPKERALKILEYSSMPSTSRHHWGTDIDLNSFNNGWFEEGEGLKLYNWMLGHAHEYGYCQPYTEKGSERPEGYNEEKWHWSYTPVSKPLLQLAAKELKNEMIKGFLGHEQATTIDVVSKYVLGINHQCK
ncbi:MAG: M15 family metallopeptidase [Saprospiraceae bacterium]|nr:M15 family metallopeptidase [Saprospiraceae bacterium]